MLPRFADRVRLGDSLMVSPFCLGMTDDWKLIPAAFDMGINFFFVTTDMHWPAYEANRKGLKALLARGKRIRDEIAIAGTCYLTQLEFTIEPFRELVASIPRMGHVDVLVAGGVYGADLLARTGALRSAAVQVRGRAVGASFHDRQAALAACNHNITDLCYVRYNPRHLGARSDLFPQLRTPRAPLFNFKSTLGYVSHERLRALKVDPDFWYPTITDYYRYALSPPEMDGVLFSVNRPQHLIALERALAAGGLTDEEQAHLDELAYRTSASPSAGPSRPGT